MAVQTPLYVATSNPGKLRDFAAAAHLYGIEVVPLPGLVSIAAPAETADSFEGNAREKAVYYSRLAPGGTVLADDSGLEVDALSGAPGVRSARYAADHGAPNPAQFSDDALNNQLLLGELAGVPAEQRTARYRCVLAAARDGVVVATAAGSIEGRILAQPRGSGGFGYDPLFLVPELGLTMAEIDLTTKQGLSHRGRALRALLTQWPHAG